MTPWDVFAAGSGEEIPAVADVSVGSSPQSFSFELDDDLVKVVTVWLEGSTCHVDIRYGRDVLLHEEGHAFEVASPVTVEKRQLGITIRAVRRGFPWLGRRLTRKF